MNIVILPAWFRLKSNTTAGSFFFEQACAMARAGHTVTVIDAQMIPTRLYLKSERDIGIRRYTEQGVTVYVYKTCQLGAARLPRLYTALYRRKVDRILKKISKTRKIDIIHAHSFYPSGVAAVALSKKYGAASVLTEHSSALIRDWLTPRSAYDYVKPTFDRADAASCVSGCFADYVFKKYSLCERPSVTPNILNPIFSFTPPPPLGDVFVFCAVSRLVPLKRVDSILRALAKTQNTRLEIAGDGPERETLMSLALELGIEERVTFHGTVSRERVFDIISSSHALVHASETETFGVTYIEALACGRPVVAVQNDGAREIIDESSGILTPLNGLADAMNSMAGDYRRFDHEAISRGCTKMYGDSRVSECYTELYGKALLHKRSGADA